MAAWIYSIPGAAVLKPHPSGQEPYLVFTRRLGAELSSQSRFAFQQVADQLQDFLRSGGFHQDRIEAGLLRPFLHFMLRPSGHGDQSDILSRWLSADLFAGVEAVQAGHADIEEHGIGMKI